MEFHIMEHTSPDRGATHTVVARNEVGAVITIGVKSEQTTNRIASLLNSNDVAWSTINQVPEN